MKARQESSSETLAALLAKVRACSACAGALPLGPRPVLQLSTSATILVASQAPGSKVHRTGVPFSDASGDRLREWTGLSSDEFYDEKSIAILPMGFCYPGRSGGGWLQHLGQLVAARVAATLLRERNACICGAISFCNRFRPCASLCSSEALLSSMSLGRGQSRRG